MLKSQVSGTLFKPAQAVIVPENDLHENFPVNKQCASLPVYSFFRILTKILFQVDADGNSAFHTALAKGYGEFIPLFLEFKLDANLKNKNGQTVFDITSPVLKEQLEKAVSPK